jgi:poly(A) polymerase
MATPSKTLPPLVPTGKISSQPWMTAPEVRSVISALTAEGAEVRFVGGCVRDAIRKIETHDIDIATPSPSEVVMALLKDQGIKAIPTGLKHGTVTVVSGIWNMEITTLRIDLQTESRHAKVAFTDDWIADAARRDFTINTLSATLDGDVYDPFSGMDDLAKGRVHFVGNAHDRIEEDVLRLLRFFRMHAIYSKFGPDKSALAACRNLAPRLIELSGERVRTEVLRILMAPEPADTLTVMRGEKVLEQIFPEATNIGRLRTLTFLETRAINVPSVVPNDLRRFASVLELERGKVDDLASRMKLFNKQAQRLSTLMTVEPPASPEIDPSTRRQRLHRLGPDIVRDLVLLAWAGELATAPHRSSKRTAEWVELLDEADTWEPVDFPLKGKDILDRGMEPGTEVGEILRTVEDWWESKDYAPDRDACLKHLAEIMAK